MYQKRNRVNNFDFALVSGQTWATWTSLSTSLTSPCRPRQHRQMLHPHPLRQATALTYSPSTTHATRPQAGCQKIPAPTTAATTRTTRSRTSTKCRTLSATARCTTRSSTPTGDSISISCTTKDESGNRFWRRRDTIRFRSVLALKHYSICELWSS